MRWRRASNEEYRSALLRHHRFPGRDRKGDARLRAQQGSVQGREQGDQAADQGSRREAVRRQGQERQHSGAHGRDWDWGSGSTLKKGKPVTVFTEGKRGQGGRNNTGPITVRFRGGGHKKA